ncbi:MAG TPA: TetR/AcrR family transcriptional regulator [Firmicutes bacterium]|nr:TetR/AcrR family transcriptional regulator [Bacillota bacterium]
MEHTTGKAEAILAAALRVFGEQGFSQARVEDIARAAGVGKGTIYEYFASKQAIFERAVEQGMTRYLNCLDEELAAPRPAEEKLRRIARLHVAFVVGHMDLAHIVAGDPGVLSERLKERVLVMRRSVEERIARILAAGMAQGRLRHVEGRVAARAFLGALAAAGMNFFEHLDRDPGVVAETVSDLFLNGLRAAPGKPE